MHFGNRLFRSTVICHLLASIASDHFSAYAEVHDRNGDAVFDADESLNRYVVKFNSEASYAASFTEVSVASIVNGIPQLNTAVMKFNSEAEAQQWASGRKDVEYLEQGKT